MTIKNFKQLPLSKESIENLTNLGYETLTQVQQKALPDVLAQKDLIVKAKTGSGKTITFTLGVLNNLDTKKYRIQTLVLCPTRELAFQVANVVKQLTRYQHNIKVLTLTGGVPYKPQVHSLSHQAHIIVGTPGRVLKHLDEKNFSTQDINTLVLDEADRMLDMGFIDDISQIIEKLPVKRQNMLFSATFNETIEKLSSEIFNNPLVIQTDIFHEKTVITQEFYNTENRDKNELIVKAFDKQTKSCIIFCNTKLQCDDLADYLEETYDMELLVLHSDFEQKYRDETLILFENKSYPLLIATDIAARGLDIDNIDLVINYEMPENFENYIHRIGRTARSGNKGKSISFLDDESYLEELNEFTDNQYTFKEVHELQKKDIFTLEYEYSTLYIAGGKKDKLRAGDILGALIQAIGIEKDDIGKISILPKCAYVAIKNKSFEKAYKGLLKNKIKNKDFKIYKR